MGLTTTQFWDYTPREYAALHDVYDAKIMRWAIERAHFANGHFKTDGIPWIPDDFMGRGNREQRIRQHRRSQVAIDFANAILAKIVPGGPIPEGLPEWARPNFGGYKDVIHGRG